MRRIQPLIQRRPAGAQRRQAAAAPRDWQAERLTGPLSCDGIQGLLRHVWASTRTPARRRSSRRSESSRANFTRTSTRATRRPRRASRRSTRPTRSSAIPRSGRSTTSLAPTGGCTSRRSGPAAPGAGRQPVRRPVVVRAGHRRLPHDERGRSLGDVRRRRQSVLRFLPDVLRRRRGAAAAVSAPRARTAEPAGPRRRARDRARPRGRAEWHVQRLGIQQQTASSEPSRSAFPPGSPRARACGSAAKANAAAGTAPAATCICASGCGRIARFERKGRDLYTKVKVPVTTAVLGGEVDVPDAGRQVAAAEGAADDAERPGLPAARARAAVDEEGRPGRRPVCNGGCRSCRSRSPTRNGSTTRHSRRRERDDGEGRRRP